MVVSSFFRFVLFAKHKLSWFDREMRTIHKRFRKYRAFSEFFADICLQAQYVKLNFFQSYALWAVTLWLYGVSRIRPLLFISCIFFLHLSPFTPSWGQCHSQTHLAWTTARKSSQHVRPLQQRLRKGNFILYFSCFTQSIWIVCFQAGGRERIFCANKGISFNVYFKLQITSSAILQFFWAVQLSYVQLLELLFQPSFFF